MTFKTTIGLLFFSLILGLIIAACGGGSDNDNPAEGESEAEAEGESEGEVKLDPFYLDAELTYEGETYELYFDNNPESVGGHCPGKKVLFNHCITCQLVRADGDEMGRLLIDGSIEWDDAEDGVIDDNLWIHLGTIGAYDGPGNYSLTSAIFQDPRESVTLDGESYPLSVAGEPDGQYGVYSHGSITLTDNADGSVGFTFHAEQLCEENPLHNECKVNPGSFDSSVPSPRTGVLDGEGLCPKP